MVVSDSNSDAESEEYEPEKILASKRGEDGQHFYLIKWVGWNNPSDCTWEIVEAYDENFPTLVEAYKTELLRKSFLPKIRLSTDTNAARKSIAVKAARKSAPGRWIYQCKIGMGVKRQNERLEHDNKIKKVNSIL